MRGVEGAGKELVLPGVVAAEKADVQPAGVVALGVAQGEWKRIGARGDGNQMDEGLGWRFSRVALLGFRDDGFWGWGRALALLSVVRGQFGL